MALVKIIATIGPPSRNPEILNKLKDRGVSFFRINLSHTDENEIEDVIKSLLDFDLPVILDTEGSQIRSGNREEINLKEGEDIKIFNEPVNCTNSQLFLNPANSIESLKVGDLISIDFNSALLKVTETKNLEKKGFILCKVLISGKVGGRKAVHVDSPTFSLPPFSKKDKLAIELAKKYHINHFTLSFMSCKEDVIEFKRLYPSAIVFSKIESRQGLNNFIEIARESNGILIDRGDLSHQVSLEKIPLIQKFIINKCHEMNKEIFVATNTLEQMSESLKPSRAEVNDIINTILDGATGIALTKETAVGKYPVETVNMLVALIKQTDFLRPFKVNEEIISKIEDSNYVYSPRTSGRLVAPHGGRLVDRFDPNYPINQVKKKLIINEETMMDVEQIAIGAFSPLEGFLGEKDFNSVIEDMRLSNGLVWTIPTILQVSQAQKIGLEAGDRIALVYEKDSKIYAVLHLDEIYKINREECARKIFGTNDPTHPGVKNFIDSGEFALGGKITMIKRRESPYDFYKLTPAQLRKIFSERGWSRVLGFHTRNVIHRSHEFIQTEGLKKSLCDGLLIHPVIGKKKIGDFEAEVIIKSYEQMMEKVYSKDKTVFCLWGYYSRYCGPRESIFTALVRKNYGCSHFIVGRDHTGVGNFYSPTASQEIFNKFKKEELGIIPIIFSPVLYDPKVKKYLQEKDIKGLSERDLPHISGTEARRILKSGKSPPDWFMRKEISKMIIDKIKKGEKVFVE